MQESKGVERMNLRKKTVLTEKPVRRAKKSSMTLQVLGRLMENKMAVAGGVIFLALVVIAILAPVLAPYSLTEMDLMSINSVPTLKHLAGTDALGRDCFSRLLHGARYSLSLGVVAALFCAFLGIVIGSIAGYFGGTVENIIMRVMDIWASIPSILLAVIMSAALGGGFINTIIALSLSGVPSNVRIIRAQILSERSKEYLEAARSINCSPVRIMFVHTLPNVLSPLIVQTTMKVGRIILDAASLSYIGLGVQPPAAEWGAMLASGRAFISTYPHLILFPGLCIMITVISINLLGDGLRDAMDPKLKN